MLYLNVFGQAKLCISKVMDAFFENFSDFNKQFFAYATVN